MTEGYLPTHTTSISLQQPFAYQPEMMSKNVITAAKHWVKIVSLYFMESHAVRQCQKSETQGSNFLSSDATFIRNEILDVSKKWGLLLQIVMHKSSDFIEIFMD